VREVEVKFEVADPTAVLIALRAHGIDLGEAVFQDDQAFAPVGWSFGDSKLGVSFLRLRTVNGRHWFAVKQPGANAQDCLEYESEVADRPQMHQAILHMGYRATVRVAKTRRLGRHGEVSLCLDELDGVGTFLELERMVPADESTAGVQEGLAAFVAALGIDARRTAETYDALVRAAQERVGGVPASRASTDEVSTAATFSGV
jgi:adenylate cyclase, class 2